MTAKTDKSASVPKVSDRREDLTCSESQIEDLLAEGESTEANPGEGPRPIKRKASKLGTAGRSPT